MDQLPSPINANINYKALFLYCFVSSPDVDVEFGRLQARDMLQHLWTGPISNASVDVVQGSRSVEVRAVGVTKVSLVFFPGFSLHYTK